MCVCVCAPKMQNRQRPRLAFKKQDIKGELMDALEEKRYAARQLARLRAPSIPASRFISTFVERKALDTLLSNSADAPTSRPALIFTNAGTISCLNLIQAGSSFFNRNGRKIQLQSLETKFQIQVANTSGAAATIEDNLLRVIFIYDAAPNGAFPAIADILQDTDQLGNNRHG